MVQTFKDNPPGPEAGCAYLRHTENRPGEHLQRLQQSQSLHHPFPGHERTALDLPEAEVEEMTSYFTRLGLESKMDGIKEWYNGYIFGGETVIYNPWSIVNYLSSPDEGTETALDKHPSSAATTDSSRKSSKSKAPGCDNDNRKTPAETEEVRKPLLTNIPYTQIEKAIRMWYGVSFSTAAISRPPKCTRKNWGLAGGSPYPIKK